MSLTPFAVFLAIAVFAQHAAAHPVKYDQRQEGDLNVRTDVEDVVFVVVPPPDFLGAGMGLVAATAADFLRKNYGAVGPEKWPTRTSPKLGFVPLEKSPYKIDLEKSGFQVKKISHPGDPNRYNFHEGKNPTKAEIKPPSPTEASAKPTTEMMMMEMMQSTTENKTVKKDLKGGEMKKEPTEKKKEMEETKITEKKKEEEKMGGEEQHKKESSEEKKQEKLSEVEQQKSKTEGKNALKVLTDDSDPDSIFSREGCGPDGYRDNEGKCVIQKPGTASK